MWIIAALIIFGVLSLLAQAEKDGTGKGIVILSLLSFAAPFVISILIGIEFDSMAAGYISFVILVALMIIIGVLWSKNITKKRKAENDDIIAKTKEKIRLKEEEERLNKLKAELLQKKNINDALLPLENFYLRLNTLNIENEIAKTEKTTMIDWLKEKRSVSVIDNILIESLQFDGFSTDIEKYENHNFSLSCQKEYDSILEQNYNSDNLYMWNYEFRNLMNIINNNYSSEFWEAKDQLKRKIEKLIQSIRKAEINRNNEIKVGFKQQLEEFLANYSKGEFIPYFDFVVKTINIKSDIDIPSRIDFDNMSSTLIIDTFLPNTNQISNIKSTRFIKVRNEYTNTLMTDKEYAKYYDLTIKKIVLRIINDCFKNDIENKLKTILFLTAGYRKSTSKQETNIHLALFR